MLLLPQMGKLKSKIFSIVGVVVILMSAMPITAMFSGTAHADVANGNVGTWTDDGTWSDGTFKTFAVGLETVFTNYDQGVKSSKKAYSSNDSVSFSCSNLFLGHTDVRTGDWAKSLGTSNFKYFVDLYGLHDPSQLITQVYLYQVVETPGANGVCSANKIGSISIQAIPKDRTSTPFTYADTTIIKPQDIPEGNFYKQLGNVDFNGYDTDIRTFTFGIRSQQDKDFYDAHKNNIQTGQVVYSAGDNDCPSYIVLDGTIGTGIKADSGYLYVYSKTDSSGSCKQGIFKQVSSGRGKKSVSILTSRVHVKISNSTVFNIATARDITVEDAPGSDGNTLKDSDALSSNGCLSWSPLSWIICPVVSMANGFINWGTSVLKDLLTITPAEYGDNGTVNHLKTAWSAMRIISTIALVGIALFMIISQILGFEFISAYNVKKIVPRLVAAVILIQLSWVLMTLSIAIINSIGSSIRYLILLPFGINKTNDGVGQIIRLAGFTGAGVDALIMSIGGTALVGSAGIFGVLAAAIGAAIAVLVALATLVIRWLLIIALMVAAPLAIVAWILPGTQKFWQMWWSNFTKLLLMFPIIMGFLAIGIAFASIVATVPMNGAIKTIIILIAYFGPFFLIPRTFKMGGELMSLTSGALNNLGGKLRTSAIQSKPMQNLKASRDYAKKIKGAERFEKYEKEKGAKGWLQRRYGQLQAGQLGTYGKYAGRTRAAERAELQKDAILEYNAFTRGRNGDQTKASNRMILSAQDGQTIEYGDRKIKITSALKQQALDSSAVLKDHDAIYAFANGDAWRPDTTAGDVEEQLKVGWTRGVNNVDTNGEVLAEATKANFPTYDKIAPDLARNNFADIQTGSKGIYGKAVSSFGNIGGDIKAMDDGSIDMTIDSAGRTSSRGQKLEVVKKLQVLARDASTRAEAASHLTTLVQGEDVSAADLTAIGKIFGFNAHEAHGAAGNAVVAADPAAPGGFKLINSATGEDFGHGPAGPTAGGTFNNGGGI